ncbi:dolichyl-phosphate-mannose--protein mannosyltransferase [Micrococcus luteus]
MPRTAVAPPSRALTGARAGDPFSESALRARLGVQRPLTTTWDWIVPLLIALAAGVMRFTALDFPDRLVFDETYYPKDAWSLLHYGYERSWPEDSDEAFAQGTATPDPDPAYVVHPPLGKWLIGLGMLVFGADNGYGWRSAAALAGTLTVLLTVLIGRRLFRSLTLGALAGVLLATEGHHLIMSRIGLLDIFLSLFVAAAFWALLKDRDDGRARLAHRLASSLRSTPDAVARRRLLASGPLLGWRPWRLLAGLLLGAGCAVKLSGLAFMAVFGLMTVLWDMEARRTAGIRHWLRAGVTHDGLGAFLAVVGGGLAVYLASWTGWFLSTDGYYRQWGAENPPSAWWEHLLPDALRSLIHYHQESTTFHAGLTSPHDYASSPWTWPFMGRPVSYFYEGGEPGEGPCIGMEVKCSSAITDIANPVLWWSGLAAVLVCLWLWIARRDWRAGALLGVYLAGQVVWFLWPERTMFFFYTVAYEPFLVLMVVLALSLLLRPGGRLGRRGGALLVVAFTLVVLAVTVFFLPVWTGEVIPYEHWRWRMWLASWI